MTGQQFQGVMQPDGTQAMFTTVPQVVVVQSPNAASMQYAMPNQMGMMAPMNQMPQQMAMQFMGQGASQDMHNFVGGQDGTGAAGVQSQAQRPPTLGSSETGLQHTGVAHDSTTPV